MLGAAALIYALEDHIMVFSPGRLAITLSLFTDRCPKKIEVFLI
jgi:hypothetical protein